MNTGRTVFGAGTNRDSSGKLGPRKSKGGGKGKGKEPGVCGQVGLMIRACKQHVPPDRNSRTSAMEPTPSASHFEFGGWVRLLSTVEEKRTAYLGVLQFAAEAYRLLDLGATSSLVCLERAVLLQEKLETSTEPTSLVDFTKRLVAGSVTENPSIRTVWPRCK